MSSSAEYLGLLLADGRLPVGAHTQSAGVEPAFQNGMTLDRLPDYLAVRLRTVTEVEAATAVMARQVWLDDSTARVSLLVEVDRAWRVRTASDALRDASDLLGRGYLRLGARLWDLRALGGRTWCRPVVLGVLAAQAGLDPRQTARLVGFEDVQAAVAAALKLKPFDPVQGVSWAVAAGADVEAMVERVAGIATVEAIPATAAPQLEHWAQLHKHSERRLFRA
ncbi:urease accessory protein UreF [Microlunatus ginsengisoli]|uniref:Urease accessory protein UreF n=1 Tax=Microlunatus ginsengisoli TaxID=363863 RepID=A0ABP6ZRD2_9ACTN